MTSHFYYRNCWQSSKTICFLINQMECFGQQILNKQIITENSLQFYKKDVEISQRLTSEINDYYFWISILFQKFSFEFDGVSWYLITQPTKELFVSIISKFGHQSINSCINSHQSNIWISFIQNQADRAEDWFWFCCRASAGIDL